MESPSGPTSFVTCQVFSQFHFSLFSFSASGSIAFQTITVSYSTIIQVHVARSFSFLNLDSYRLLLDQVLKTKTHKLRKALRLKVIRIESHDNIFSFDYLFE